MTETTLGHLAEPAEIDSTYGGFAEIARRLNALHPERPVPFSRQLVARWYDCRGANKFPERQPGEKVLFDLVEVERWHAEWMRERHPGKPPIETIPLFHVNHRGHPVDIERDTVRERPVVQESYRSSVLDL